MPMRDGEATAPSMDQRAIRQPRYVRNDVLVHMQPYLWLMTNSIIQKSISSKNTGAIDPETWSVWVWKKRSMSNGRLPLAKIGSLTIAFASTGAGDPPGRGWLLLLLFFVLAGGNSRSTRLSSRCCFYGWTRQRPMLSGGMMMHIAEAAASLELHCAAVEAGGIFAKGRHILEWRHGCVWVVERVVGTSAVEK